MFSQSRKTSASGLAQAPRAHASKKWRTRGRLSRRVLIEGLFEKGKGKQTPKALSARQTQRQLRKQQERGARALFPEGTEKIADGGARRHHRNAVQKTASPAEGWQRIGSRGWCLAPLPGCLPWGAAGSRGYRFAQTPATFWDAFGIRDPQGTIRRGQAF
jgi:hypothetical protein